MKAFITSIGESTTELCKWSLKRQGFDVEVIKDAGTSLAHKLWQISNVADDDYLRVDADTVVNANIQLLAQQQDLWWYQSLTFDWWKQDITHGGIQLIRKQALPAIKRHINEIERLDRPESYLYRLQEFHNPRKCGTFDMICGVNGYKQSDVLRVKDTKERRQQTGYDWELALRLNSL